jgi:hypothetical protein
LFDKIAKDKERVGGALVAARVEERTMPSAVMLIAWKKW